MNTPENPITPTPRTHAEWNLYVKNGWHDAGQHFAEGLERELAAACAALAHAREALRTSIPSDVAGARFSDFAREQNRAEAAEQEVERLRGVVAALEESAEILQGNPSPEAIDTVRAMLAAAIAKAKGQS